MRIDKLKDYMYGVINTISSDKNFQINADFLGNVGDYSLNKISTTLEKEPPWITGTKVKKEVYSFRSRKHYSRDKINNLENIGFFEKLEHEINSNNENGILPDIEKIESINCLTSGALNMANTSEATFDIQIQITYLDDENTGGISL